MTKRLQEKQVILVKLFSRYFGFDQIYEISLGKINSSDDFTIPWSNVWDNF